MSRLKRQHQRTDGSGATNVKGATGGLSASAKLTRRQAIDDTRKKSRGTTLEVVSKPGGRGSRRAETPRNSGSAGASPSRYRVLKPLQGTLAIAVIIMFSSTARAADQHSASVGMPAKIEQLVLPGSELEARPLEDRQTPIVVRMTGSYRHGTDYRYDLVYYGLEPGEFDLKNYLRRKDGSSMDDLPAIPITIRPVLPPGQVEPNTLESQPAPSLGGYRTLLIASGVVWLLGLLAILFVGRGQKGGEASDGQRAVTLADRLRPIVEDAIAGKISHGQQAELERMLLAFWRKRLGLQDMKASEAIIALRDHEEAGALLKQLEIWLHRPGTAGEVDVAELLKPYQNLPADALERVLPRGGT